MTDDIRKLNISSDNIVDIPLDKILLRSANAYPITDISGLMESIRNNGLLQPIIVSHESDNNYRLIAGERRYTAVKRLRDEYTAAGDDIKANLFSTISAFVVDSLSESQEEQIYRDTNDYSRQLSTFQRIVLLEPWKIDMSTNYWKEEFVRRVYGETKVISWKAGFIMVRGTKRERSKLVQAMLLEKNPDLEVSEKTVRNYLALLDRCNEDLRMAAVMGKVSIHDAFSLSWNSSLEQSDAVRSIGKEVYKDYIEEGNLRSGSGSRKEKRSETRSTRRIRSYRDRFIKLAGDCQRELDQLRNTDPSSPLLEEMEEQLLNVIETINKLNET